MFLNDLDYAVMRRGIIGCRMILDVIIIVHGMFRKGIITGTWSFA